MFARIYRIVHVDTRRCYVGHTCLKVTARWAEHKYRLRRGNHHSPHMQRAWNAYGERTFSFELLEVCLEEVKLMREQFYLDTMNSCFNHAKVAGSRLGVAQPDSGKAWGNKHTLGRKPPPEEIERRAAFHRGRKRSDKTRAKMSASMTGITHGVGHEVSEMTRLKISLKNRGRKNTPEQEARRIISRRRSSPLSDEKVADIRRRRAGGEKGVKLAQEFGVSTALMSMICSGNRWKDAAQLTTERG